MTPPPPAATRAQPSTAAVLALPSPHGSSEVTDSSGPPTAAPGAVGGGAATSASEEEPGADALAAAAAVGGWLLAGEVKLPAPLAGDVHTNSLKPAGGKGDKELYMALSPRRSRRKLTFQTHKQDGVGSVLNGFKTRGSFHTYGWAAMDSEKLPLVELGASCEAHGHDDVEVWRCEPLEKSTPHVQPVHTYTPHSPGEGGSGSAPDEEDCRSGDDGRPHPPEPRPKPWPIPWPKPCTEP